MSGQEIVEADVAKAADHVAASWRQGIESIIETGRRLIEIRDRWKHEPGKWSRLIGDNQWKGQSLLPFQKTHAQMLVRVAGDRWIPRHVGVLPSDSYTLGKLCSLSDERRDEMLFEGLIHPGMKRNDLKAAERARQNQELSPQAFPAGKYPVIYADPPWTFNVWSGEGKDRAAENHYPTMSQSDIEALPISSLAADDCALFLWGVMPQLPEALAVIEAWGFEYKTCAFVWVKQTKDGSKFATGMGYWTRANAEICLLATRGSPKRINADVQQVIASPRQEHSRKPEEVAQRIERLVSGPYLELFARRARENWDVWGNQI